MSWEKSSYTAAGAALLSESLSGGALVITRAVSGTGTADADLSGETGVSGETHDLKLLDIETVESGGETARRVKIQITGADETYIMHQVGVYGRLNDDAETLLFIMQDARGVEVPSTKVNGDFEIELSALLAVSNKANISITVDPQVQALMKLVKAEIEKHNADASAHATTITAAVSAAVKNLSESGEILNEEQVKALLSRNRWTAEQAATMAPTNSPLRLTGGSPPATRMITKTLAVWITTSAFMMQNCRTAPVSLYPLALYLPAASILRPKRVS